MREFLRRLQFPIVIIMFLTGSAFLLKMCYLSLAFNTVFGIVFLTCMYAYVRACYELAVPPLLLLLVMGGVEVDALGNYWRMYGSPFGPLQYDEFAHLTIQVLVTPIIVWLAQQALDKLGYRVSLRFTTLFAGMMVFSLSAFYEIVELWDELYFGGHRIWSTQDTAKDLQFDLCGIVAGAALAYLLLKRETLRKWHGRPARGSRASCT